MKPAQGIFCCCGELDCLQVVWQMLSKEEWELGGALGGLGWYSQLLQTAFKSE